VRSSPQRPLASRRQPPEEAAWTLADDSRKQYIGRPVDEQGAPRATGAPHRKTLEERIWGAFLDAPRPRPPEKELQEALAFLKKIDRSLTKKFDVVHAVDVCGGHGLLAMLMLIMGKAKKCYVLDLQFPPSATCLLKAFSAAGLLRDPHAVVWVKGDVVETLPRVLDSVSLDAAAFAQERDPEENESTEGDDRSGSGREVGHLAGGERGTANGARKSRGKRAVNAVVGIHACNYLTDVILDAAVEAAVPFALMPCCHADRSGALKQAASVVGAPLAAAVDIARMGSLLERGCTCHMFSIPAAITPVNRILLGIPPPWNVVGSAAGDRLAHQGGASNAGEGAAGRFTGKQHDALLNQSRKMLRAPAQARGRRFSPREHQIVIQRAIALQCGGRTSALSAGRETGELQAPGDIPTL
jgi:hypothetical protein